MGKVWKGNLDWSKIVVDNESKDVKINKGIAFENVVELLLKSQFKEEYWVRTQETHDGKKDYVHPNEINPTEWLECKNYNNRLSINVISPTLVMGSINGISRIYIYSRSPLNENALEDICLYRQAQGCDIIVYDGELLEYCIYLHRAEHDFEKFFPEINLRETAEKLEINRPLFFYSLRDIHGNKLTSKYKFELGESFKLNIIVQNRTSSKLDFCINIGNSQNRVKFLQQRIYESLSFGELKLYTVVCETIRAGKTTISIKITHNQSNDKVKFLPGIEIKDEPYCFLIPKWIDIEKSCLSVLYSMADIPVILCGGSGTGKSTLIRQIIADFQLNEKYTVLNFDTRFQCVSIMENLVLQVVGLRKERHRDDESFIIEDLSEILSRYFLSFEQFAEKFSKMGKFEKPFLFIIDDAQTISHHQLSFIKTLKQVLHKYGRDAVFLFALNSDEMKLDNFLKRMCWDKLYENIRCEIIPVPKFDKTDVINYFAYAYGITETKDLFGDFNKEISPLEISKFANLLKQKGIIQKLLQNGGDYVILDYVVFREYIERFLYVNNTLSKIYEDYGYYGYVDFILKYVYLNGEICTEQVEYEEDIESLVSAQVFKRSGNVLMFAHEKLREAVVEFLHFNDDDYVKIFFDSSVTPYAKAICAIAEAGKIREAEMSLNCFLNNTENCLRTDERLTICKSVVENINKLQTCNLNLASTALNYVKNSYKILNDEIGREKLSKFLSNAAETFLSCNWWVSEKNIAESVCFLLKKHLDRILSLHKNEACMLCAQNCITKMQEVSGLTDRDKNYWLCHFHNRRAIALSRLDKTPDSDYKLSYSYSKNANKWEELELQITVDDFYKHYSYQSDLTEELTRNFLDRLEKIDSIKLKDKTDCLNYHIALLHFLLHANGKKDTDNVECLMDMAKNVIENNKSPYYALKIRILKIYILMYKKAYSVAEDLYFEALEFAYTHEFRQFVYRLNYIYAHLLKWMNKTYANGKDFADIAFLSLKQLTDTKIGLDKEYSYDAIRETNTALRLIEMCKSKYPDYLNEFSAGQKKFIEKITKDGNVISQSATSALELRFDGVLFPNC